MPWVHHINRVSVRRRGSLSWTVALLVFLISLVVRIVFAPLLDNLAFLTLYPAVAATAVICGIWEGVLVLVLSALSGYLFLAPTGLFASKGGGSAHLAVAGFLIGGGLVVLLMAALRETIRRVELAKAVQETLFRELQHRVANNLQLVVALLRNAQRNLRNPVVAAETINDAEARILAMSELHRRLNDGTAYANGLEPLLQEMCAHAFRDLPVTVRVHVKGEPGLSIVQMTALTLLVNEAALNAAKHVFSKGLGTRFDVSLSVDEGGHLRLLIEDDGPGMTGNAVTEAGSLGMGIMEAFATQLGGSLKSSTAPARL